MKRLTLPTRPDWQEIARQSGFHFHHVDGDLYWDESVCYALSLQEIEQGLEDPAQELADMCLDLVDDIVRSESLLKKLEVPEYCWDMVRDSWGRHEPSLYGRFDFAFDGHGPAKLYEYNADTPTSLYEAAYFQWNWLEDAMILGILPGNADQFNSIQERLIETLASFDVRGRMHFASVRDSEEDRATVEYLLDCATQAGIEGRQMYIEDIAVDTNGQFIDEQRQAIRWLFKLYPWEFMVRDDFGQYLSQADTTFVEPAWKMVLSNKGILPLLWERHKGHPNLLPAWFQEGGWTPAGDCVLKPLYSREGANIRIIRDGKEVLAMPGNYGQGIFIRQAFCPPPCVDGHGPVAGVWIVGGRACGLGFREDDSLVTGNLSRFVPHCILE